MAVPQSENSFHWQVLFLPVLNVAWWLDQEIAVSFMSAGYVRFSSIATSSKPPFTDRPWEVLLWVQGQSGAENRAEHGYARRRCEVKSRRCPAKSMVVLS